MLHERHAWAILVAILSTRVFSSITSGIVIALLFMALFQRSFQPMPVVSTLYESIPEDPTLPSPHTQTTSTSGSLFSGAHNFSINNSTMTEISGEGKAPRIMELLLKHIIIGAAHDDSTRNYPPRCHPGTRVKILQRLTSWCYNINRVKCLLWLCGPAGVGKSAIIQSFAESVGKLVASVFISRPNKRNDPNRIFTTIAYQLAVNINSYRTYIVDRIATDPCILNKNMHVQFQTFIVEPFVEARISTGGKPVAILLDGLDEVEGVDTQRDIIRLISKFTQQHPDSSLTWIISSRPESHIKSTFNETTIQDQIELEFIPIDSTEACADVERFFRDSFLSIRHEFPDTTLTNWPEETALAKLAVAASGLFIFAETVVRFMRDPDYANPISRLQLVLSVIDRCRNVSIQEQPFIFLDNLYTEIMSNIPSGLLPTAKLLMRLALAFRNDTFLGLSSKSKSRTLRGMKLILQLDRFTVYAALSKFYSTLGIPSWQEAHQNTLTFLHASFADYLMDSRRSGEFSIDIEGVEEEVLLFYLNLWHVQFGETQVPNVSLVDERDDDRKIEAEYVEEFNTGIFEDMAGASGKPKMAKNVSRLGLKGHGR